MQIALALGGGGAKGIAHLGVVGALQKQGFEIAAITGTSIGGLVGALLACGYTPDDLRARFSRLDQRKLFGHREGDLPSLLGLAGLAGELAGLLGEREFPDLDIPFAVTAVDIRACESRTLNKGPVLEAVLSTIAIPGIFPPRPTEDGGLLVDGGMTNPVPVDVAQKMSPRLPVVAVPLSMIPSAPLKSAGSGLLAPFRGAEYLSRLRMGQAMNTFLESWDVSTRLLTRMRLEMDRPDIILTPQVDDIQLLGQVDVDDVFARGEQAVEAAQRALAELASPLGRARRLLGLGRGGGR